MEGSFEDCILRNHFVKEKVLCVTSMALNHQFSIPRFLSFLAVYIAEAAEEFIQGNLNLYTVNNETRDLILTDQIESGLGDSKRLSQEKGPLTGWANSLMNSGVQGSSPQKPQRERVPPGTQDLRKVCGRHMSGARMLFGGNITDAYSDLLWAVGIFAAQASSTVGHTPQTPMPLFP